MNNGGTSKKSGDAGPIVTLIGSIAVIMIFCILMAAVIGLGVHMIVDIFGWSWDLWDNI